MRPCLPKEPCLAEGRVTEKAQWLIKTAWGCLRGIGEAVVNVSGGGSGVSVIAMREELSSGSRESRLGDRPSVLRVNRLTACEFKRHFLRLFPLHA